MGHRIDWTYTELKAKTSEEIIEELSLTDFDVRPYHLEQELTHRHEVLQLYMARATLAVAVLAALVSILAVVSPMRSSGQTNPPGGIPTACRPLVGPLKPPACKP